MLLPAEAGLVVEAEVVDLGLPRGGLALEVLEAGDEVLELVDEVPGGAVDGVLEEGEVVGELADRGGLDEAAAHEVLDGVGDALGGVAGGGHGGEDPDQAVAGEEAGVEQEDGDLEVVVDGDDAGAVGGEAVERGAAVEVDEDPPDDVAGAVEAAVEGHDLVDVVAVDLAGGEDRGHALGGDPAGEDVGVEAVDEGVLLGVVAEQVLGVGLVAEVAVKERLELVADLAAQGPEAAAQEVLEVGLEDEDVGLDAVELELAGEHAAHLIGRAADEGDVALVAVGGVEQGLQERLGAGDGGLVLGLLPEGLDQVLEAVEVGGEVGLVEVPAQVDHAARGLRAGG